LAKQTAYYVVIYSPLQMAADMPEHYEGEPAFQFIVDVPCDGKKQEY
jgi:alpha-glucosidase